MKTCFDYIVGYVSEKKKSSFTGSIKFSFEKAKLVSIVESNRLDGFDTPPTEIPQDSMKHLEIFKKCFEDDFCGSFSYIFNDGETNKYNYVKTLKGDGLHKILGAEKCRCVKVVVAR